MSGPEALNWNEESANELGVDYDPSQYWIERTSAVRKQVRERRETLRSYKQLRETLEEVLGKTKHKVMIPCGEMAILEGTIKHTNEILAFLGASWFAERSIPQCRRIVSKREEVIQEDLDGLIEEEKNCQKRLQLLLRFEGFADEPAEAEKKKTRPHKDIESAQTVREKLQIIEEMEAKGLQTEFEVDSEGDGETTQTSLPVLSDDEIANRLRSAGLIDTPSSGIMAKLDEMFSPDAEEPKFVDPSQIFSSYSAPDDVNTPEIEQDLEPEKPLKKRVSFSDKNDIKLHPDDENTKTESETIIKTDKPNAVGEAVVIRSSSCIPPPPPPMRTKK